MSNFTLKVKNKYTGEIFQASALDDYYGRHKYGYKIADIMYTEEEFNNQFEEVVS